MRSAGIDLSAVIAAACRYRGIEVKELARPTICVEIARARVLISYVATQMLSISGSEVAHRFNVDRSAISRAIRRVSRNPDLIATTKTFLGLLCLKKSQHYRMSSQSLEKEIFYLFCVMASRCPCSSST